MATYTIKPANNAKDKDLPEIMIGGGALGLTLGGIAGWVVGGVPDAILGGLAGSLIAGYLSHLLLRRIRHVSKDMQMDRE